MNPNIDPLESVRLECLRLSGPLLRPESAGGTKEMIAAARAFEAYVTAPGRVKAKAKPPVTR